MFRRILVASVMFAGCTGSTSVDPATIAPLEAPVQTKPKTKVVKAKALTKAPSQVRKLKRGSKLPWTPRYSLKGTEGRLCSVFKDRVVVTRPLGEEWEVRVRPVDLDREVQDGAVQGGGDQNLDRDCQWDGPIMVEGRVDGEVIGAIWPHVVLFGKPMFGGVGARLQIMNGNTGGITADVASAANPRYSKSLVVGFRLPVAAEIKRVDGQSCEEAIQVAWDEVYSDLQAGDRLTPMITKKAPMCPPSAMDTCAAAFLLPYELLMSEQGPRRVMDEPAECTDAARL